MSILDKVLQMIPLKSKEVFDFEVAVAQNVFDDKFVFFSKVYKTIFFSIS